MILQIIEVLNNLREVGYEVEEIEVEACFKRASQILKDSEVEIQVPALTVVIEDILFNDEKYYQSLMEENYGCSIVY